MSLKSVDDSGVRCCFLSSALESAKQHNENMEIAIRLLCEATNWFTALLSKYQISIAPCATTSHLLFAREFQRRHTLGAALDLKILHVVVPKSPGLSSSWFSCDVTTQAPKHK